MHSFKLVTKINDPISSDLKTKKIKVMTKKNFNYIMKYV